MTYEQSFNGSLITNPLGGKLIGEGAGNVYYAIPAENGGEILVIVAPDGSSRFYTD